ncbi:unnamed protein product [Allacma fusca]|uniref:Uncharacterized protein n=1 Tax=Allacma fusca TaxID=39272 RepID=A0A8J2PP40_9HEXA|nr:unnamed protein product [Allacma fusca]
MSRTEGLSSLDILVEFLLLLLLLLYTRAELRRSRELYFYGSRAWAWVVFIPNSKLRQCMNDGSFHETSSFNLLQPLSHMWDADVHIRVKLVSLNYLPPLAVQACTQSL